MFALIGGHFYVVALGSGVRAYVYIHGGILIFLGMAIFLGNIKTFFFLLMMLAMPMDLGRYFVYEPVPFESSLFSYGLRIDFVDVVLIIGYIHWGIALLNNQNVIRPIILGGKVGWAFSIYILYIVFSSFLVAKRLNYSMYELYDILKGFLLYFYIINNINSNKELKIVVYAICASGILLSLFMIAQYILKTNFNISGISGTAIYQTGPEGFRSRGFTGSPDEACTILLTIFQFFFVGVLLVKDRLKKSVMVTSIVLFLIAIIFSKTRIAIAALGVGVITSLLCSYRRSWISGRQVFWTVTACLFTVIASIPFVYHRFAYGVYGEDRWPLMVTAYNMFKSNVMFGVGINNYSFVVYKYIPANFSSAWLYVVHNEYLLRLSETGILGFMFYYVLLTTVVMGFHKLTFSTNRFISGTSIALFAVMIGSIVHRVVSIYHYEPFFLLECTICALAPAMKFLENRDEKV